MKDILVIRALPSGEWEIQIETQQAGQSIIRGKRCAI